METIDIAPRFTAAAAKLVEEKQDKLHQAVISVAEMMQALIRSLEQLSRVVEDGGRWVEYLLFNPGSDYPFRSSGNWLPLRMQGGDGMLAGRR